MAGGVWRRGRSRELPPALRPSTLTSLDTQPTGPETRDYRYGGEPDRKARRLVGNDGLRRAATPSTIEAWRHRSKDCRRGKAAASGWAAGERPAPGGRR